MHHGPEILGADIDMDKNRLRTTGHSVVPMSGGEGREFERAENGLDGRLPEGSALGDCFLDGKRVRAGIQKEVRDTMGEERFDIGFGDLDLPQLAGPSGGADSDFFCHALPPEWFRSRCEAIVRC